MVNHQTIYLSHLWAGTSYYYRYPILRSRIRVVQIVQIVNQGLASHVLCRMKTSDTSLLEMHTDQYPGSHALPERLTTGMGTHTVASSLSSTSQSMVVSGQG